MFLYIASQAASANSNRMLCSYFSATDIVKMGNILISVGTTDFIIFVYGTCFVCVGGGMCCVGGEGLGDGVRVRYGRMEYGACVTIRIDVCVCLIRNI